MSRAVKWNRLCLACGHNFQSVRSDASLCSPRCRKRWERATTEEREQVQRRIELLREGGMDSQDMVEMAIRAIMGGRRKPMMEAKLGGYA